MSEQLREVPVTVPPQIGITDGMKSILEDNNAVNIIHKARPEVDRVLAQLQLDITTEGNRDTVGPTILALRLVRETFALFSARGAAVDAVAKRTESET